MRRALFLFFVLTFTTLSAAFAGNKKVTPKAETIRATEIDSHIYIDGKMVKEKEQYTITYHMVGNKITRVHIRNNNKGTDDTDDTVYNIIDIGVNPYTGSNVIWAIGKPGTQALEMLIIENGFITGVRSFAGNVVISKQKILK